MARIRRCRRRWHNLLLICAGTCLTTPAAQTSARAAEPPQPPAADPVTRSRTGEPTQSGGAFAAILFTQPAIPGPISFASVRANAWDEGPVRRLLLDESVKITLAGHRFEARNAAVWMQRTQRDGAPVEQIFIYFEHVTSTATGGIAIASQRLPVRAVISPTGAVELAADLITKGPAARATPLGAFADRADQALAAAAPQPLSPVEATPAIQPSARQPKPDAPLAQDSDPSRRPHHLPRPPRQPRFPPHYHRPHRRTLTSASQSSPPRASLRSPRPTPTSSRVKRKTPSLSPAA